MKNLILSVLNLLIIFVVNGKEDTISDSTFNDSKLGFGATIGITKFNYYLSQREAFIPDDIPFTELRGKQVIGTGAKDILGLNIGFITNYKLSNDLEIRISPSLLFGELRVNFNIPVPSFESFTHKNYYIEPVTFVNIPFLFKKKIDFITKNSYLVLGSSLKYIISENSKASLINLKKEGFFAELGYGIERNTNFSKLSFELNFSLGFGNKIGPEPKTKELKWYWESIEKFNLGLITLGVNFE